MRSSLVLSVAFLLGSLAFMPACDLLFSSAECQEDSDCNGDDVCDDGTCVECDSDSDCDDNEECDDGDCEAVSEGEGEGEEGEGEGEGEEGEGEGEEGEGEGEGEGGIACFNTSECPINDFCNAALGECAPLEGTGLCRLDSQCDASTPVCAGSENVPGQCVECEDDFDCASGTCDLSTLECAPSAGCDTSGFSDPDGDGLTASDALLEEDPDNLGECALVSDAFLVSFFLDDTSINDVQAGDVRFSVNGGFSQACATFPSAFDGIVICPVCFATPPSDMSIQFDDGIQTSNAVCVDTSGV